MNQERAVRRRVARSVEEKQALLASWDASGLSARAFGEREGVRTSCLWRWKRAAKLEMLKSRKQGRSSSTITFAPVHVTTPTTKRGAVAAERVLAEVLLANDVRVRVLEGADTRQVTALVQALSGAVSC
jgi:hypothetical protein